MTVCARSILLRGFDQQIAELIGADMIAKGVTFIRPVRSGRWEANSVVLSPNRAPAGRARCSSPHCRRELRPLRACLSLFDAPRGRKTGLLRPFTPLTRSPPFQHPPLQATPTLIEKTADGRLRVTWTHAETGATASDVFDTVLTATGRTADTAKLDVAAAGVPTARDGKIPAIAEQTAVPHVYALGDVVVGNPELTPVAIAAGKLLARRLYGGGTEGVDMDRIPTTVFTPLEYGCVGLAEEDAAARLGADGIEVYHSALTPLEWTVPEGRPENKCYAKIVVDKASDRVVGFHYLGPNAGEITQGWATAMRLGATYASFRSTIGIHPTIAEEFTTLSVTKASGASADKSGC